MERLPNLTTICGLFNIYLTFIRKELNKLSSIFTLRFALIAAADEETASFMAVISSAILLNESVRADVSVESLMVLSFILKLLKIIKCVSCGEL